MPVTLLLPGALLPREVVNALAEPLAATALASTLGRAQLVGDSEVDAPAHLAWIAEHLFQRQGPLATAPYAWSALTGTPPDNGFVWHADPVHLELARDHLVLRPLPAPPTDEEAAALLAAANALATDAGLEFTRIQDRWFLRASQSLDVETKPLAAALGRPLDTVMPAGRDAARWNRLLTEIQMSWHEHPVNEAREARGERAVNSVWLHGGGAWSALPRPHFAAVLADESEWRGAAHAAGIGSGKANDIPADNTLVIRSEVLSPRLLQDWTGWTHALHALDAPVVSLARAGEVDFVLTGETTVRRLRSRPADRLKFWRAASLAQVLSE